MTMGEKILNMRKARGWSQEELSEQVGVSRQAVSRWESGAAKPDADRIITICDLFGVSADYLLRDDYRGELMCAETGKPKVSLKKRWGGYLTWAGIGSLFLLLILNSAFPASVILDYYYNEYGNLQPIQAKGLRGFLMYYNLEWLFLLICGSLLTGLILLWKETSSIREKTAVLLARGKALFHKK